MLFARVRVRAFYPKQKNGKLYARTSYIHPFILIYT
jgi:hypothetical protein